MIRLLLPIALFAGVDAPPTPESPALVVKLVKPDRQLARFLDLFEGGAKGTPAKALSEWKRAKAGRGFTKAAEAGFAVLNPEMVRELRSLDGLAAFAGVSNGGAVEWGVAVPGDDGTFDALATALALTDGARVEDLDGRAVDRLGPPGAPLICKAPGGRGTLLGSTREALRAAGSGVSFEPKSVAVPESGFVVRIDAVALGRRTDLLAKRVSEGLLGAGLPVVEAVGSLGGESWELVLGGRREGEPALGPAAIDPAWIVEIPSKNLAGAFAVAIDPRPEFWNKLFEWGDRVEKVDPVRAEVAPLRLRLAILTGGLGINPESDLFPHLKGASGFALGGDERRGVLVLHFKDAAKAGRFLEKTLIPLARSFKRGDPAVGPDRIVSWPNDGALKDLEIKADGADLRIGWGRGVLTEAASAAKAAPASLGFPVGTPPQRFVHARPGTIDSRFPSASTIVWTGGVEGTWSRDRIVVSGLREIAVRTLERLLAGEPK